MAVADGGIAGQKLGRRLGGLARAAKLTAEQRREISRHAAETRWANPHPEPKPKANPLGRREIAYFRERLKGRMFSIIIRELRRQQNLDPSINAAWIARRLRRQPEQVAYWLAGPSDLTLDQISDLFLVLFGSEPDITVIDKLTINR